MKKMLIGTAVFALAAVSSGSVIQAAPPAGVDVVEYVLIFDNANQTKSFEVEAAKGAGTLTVETLDCCVQGDIWVTLLEHVQPVGADTDSGTGDGNTTTYSGSASRKGWSKGTVTIQYSAGSGIFAAEVRVRFTYSSNGNGKAKGNTGMIVTQIS